MISGMSTELNYAAWSVSTKFLFHKSCYCIVKILIEKIVEEIVLLLR